MTHPRSRCYPAAGPAARRLCGVLLLACALFGETAPGALAQPGAPGLTITDAWLRLIMTARPAAGYFTLRNDTDKTVSLIGASSPDCGTLMLHRSVQQSGQDRMEMVKAVPVPAHGKVVFAPGGYHLMCMSPAAMLRPGKTMQVTLSFADGSTVTTGFPVRDATGH